jgi:hypothetical protein
MRPATTEHRSIRFTLMAELAGPGVRSPSGPLAARTHEREQHGMSDLHPNVLTYLAAIDAFNRNNLTAVGKYMRPDFRYRIPGRSRVAGEFRGIDDFVEALTRLRDESAGTIALTPRGRARRRREPHRTCPSHRSTRRKRLDTENCYAFRFLDSKVADGQVFLSDPEQVEEFWTTTDAER